MRRYAGDKDIFYSLELTSHQLRNDKYIHARKLKKLEQRVIVVFVVICTIPLWPLLFMKINMWTNGNTFLGTLTDFHSGAKKIIPAHSQWVMDFIKNIIGYAAIFVPVYLISIYLHRIKYEEISGSGLMAKIIKSCIFGSSSILPTAYVPTASSSQINKGSLIKYWSRFCSPLPGSFGYYCLLLFSASGLQVSYLTWGILQERIMTQKYGKENFRDSQFLVFLNRLLAAFLAGTILVAQGHNFKLNSEQKSAPYFKYSYASLSNILSSWCQYEALKFVSFPVQVLAKASKIIPVMLMGKLIRNQSYRLDEYISSVIISLGVFLFLFDTSSHNYLETVKSDDTYNRVISGTLLLFGYMLLDSFTSNWQDRLFKTYKISPLQMMFGINLWSCLFTLSSLIEKESIQESLTFAANHSEFIVDILLLSFCGAVGQLFIFFTINKFGAVIFVVIMTLRQAIAILLSVILYRHPVGLIGLIGVMLVFTALFSRIYCSHRS